MLKKAAVLIIGLVLLMSAVQAKNDNIGAKDDKYKANVVDKDCLLLASDGNLDNAFMGKGKLVIEKNEITFTCKGKQPAPYPGKAVRFTGLEMGFPYEINPVGAETFTPYAFQNWKEVIKPNGQVTLKAKIHLKPHEEKEDKEDED